MSKQEKKLNMSERAQAIVEQVTGDARKIVQARMGTYSPVEIACLARAYELKSPTFAQEVLNHAATRIKFDELAAEQIASGVNPALIVVPNDEPNDDGDTLLAE